MLLGLVSINWAARVLFPLEEPETEHKGTTYRIALLVACVVFLGFACLQYPDTIIKRPHPVFWRFLLGIISIYCAVLGLLLCLPLNSGRRMMAFFDPRLGQPQPEHQVMMDCRIYTPENEVSQFKNVYDIVTEVHMLAHFLGWWGKVLIIRDMKVAWICSIMFELCELSFRHWLPSLNECWWDSLLLDTFGCNWLGIFFGSLTLQYFAVHKLHWIYVKPKDNDGNCKTYI